MKMKIRGVAQWVERKLRRWWRRWWLGRAIYQRAVMLNRRIPSRRQTTLDQFIGHLSMVRGRGIAEIQERIGRPFEMMSIISGRSHLPRSTEMNLGRLAKFYKPATTDLKGLTEVRWTLNAQGFNERNRCPLDRHSRSRRSGSDMTYKYGRCRNPRLDP